MNSAVSSVYAWLVATIYVVVGDAEDLRFLCGGVLFIVAVGWCAERWQRSG